MQPVKDKNENIKESKPVVKQITEDEILEKNNKKKG